MDIFRMRCFVTAVQFGSLTKSAEYLNITQPAMSFQIRELERELGVTVFNRSGKGITLTPAGELLHSGFVQIIDTYNRVVENTRLLAGTKKRLTIGFHGPLGWAGIHDFLSEFAGRHPDIELVVLQQDLKELAEYLRTGALDISFGHDSATPAGKGIVSYPLFSEKSCFAMSAQHRLAGRSELTVEDVRGERILMNNQSGSGLNATVDQLIKSGISRDRLMLFDRREMTLAMAASNQGIAAVPRSFKTADGILSYVDYDSDDVLINNVMAVNTELGNSSTAVFVNEAMSVAWPFKK